MTILIKGRVVVMALLTATLFIACRSSRQTSALRHVVSDSLSLMSARATTDSIYTTAHHTLSHNISSQSSTAIITEEITYSAPDSLGNQYISKRSVSASFQGTLRLDSIFSKDSVTYNRKSDTLNQTNIKQSIKESKSQDILTVKDYAIMCTVKDYITSFIIAALVFVACYVYFKYLHIRW